MTDNEIIKALECCKANINLCNSCPIDQEKQDDCTCGTFLAGYALDLINRQKAEIERLSAKLEKRETELDRLTIYFDKAVEEKIKEFAERLKEKAIMDAGIWYVAENDIDNLVKEMVGECE